MAALVEHTCMVVAKKSSMAVIEKTLSSLGISKIVAPNSFREVTELALQELPHIFILESDLADCSMMMILNKIKQDPLFAPAQFILVKKFSREEILQCVEAKVQGMLQQPLDPAALLQKLKTLLIGLKGLSPYRMAPELLPGGKNVSIKVTGKISGIQGDFFTVEAGAIIPSGKQITLRPNDPDKVPLRVTSAGPADSDDSKPLRSILFSKESATGKGREWLFAVAPAPVQKTGKRQILLYESNIERGMQFQKMLAFYDIEAMLAPNFDKLKLVHEAHKDRYKIIYLCEPPIHASGISWEKYTAAFTSAERPLQIVATTSQNPMKKPGVTWMKMPFGLDNLVEQFEAAFVQTSLQGGAAPGSTKVEDVPLTISFFADLVSIDETGALLDSSFEFPVNSRLSLTHPALTLIELSKNVRVAGVKRLDAAGTKFRVRLSNQEGQVSIGRYWKPIAEKLQNIAIQPPPPAATPQAAAGSAHEADAQPQAGTAAELPEQSAKKTG